MFGFLQWRAHNGALPCWWHVAREHGRWPSSKLSGYRCLLTVHQHQSLQSGGTRAPSRSPPVSWWSKRCTDSLVVILPGVWMCHMAIGHVAVTWSQESTECRPFQTLHLLSTHVGWNSVDWKVAANNTSSNKSPFVLCHWQWLHHCPELGWRFVNRPNAAGKSDQMRPGHGLAADRLNSRTTLARFQLMSWTLRKSLSRALIARLKGLWVSGLTSVMRYNASVGR